MRLHESDTDSFSPREKAWLRRNGRPRQHTPTQSCSTRSESRRNRGFSITAVRSTCTPLTQHLRPPLNTNRLNDLVIRSAKHQNRPQQQQRRLTPRPSHKTNNSPNLSRTLRHNLNIRSSHLKPQRQATASHRMKNHQRRVNSPNHLHQQSTNQPINQSNQPHPTVMLNSIQYLPEYEVPPHPSSQNSHAPQHYPPTPLHYPHNLS
jgi:hypothetical protein